MVERENAERRGRREQVEWRREQLLRAALRVFGERGVEAASIKEIAAEADVAPGLIHHYFGRKEDLVMAVLDRFGFLSELEELIADAAGRPIAEVFTDIASHFGKVLADDADLMTVFLTGFANPPVREGLNAYIAEGQAFLAELLAERVAAGELRPHDTTASAQLLLSAIAGGHLTRSPPDPEALVDLFLRGVGRDKRRR